MHLHKNRPKTFIELLWKQVNLDYYSSVASCQCSCLSSRPRSRRPSTVCVDEAAKVSRPWRRRYSTWVVLVISVSWHHLDFLNTVLQNQKNMKPPRSRLPSCPVWTLVLWRVAFSTTLMGFNAQKPPPPQSSNKAARRGWVLEVSWLVLTESAWPPVSRGVPVAWMEVIVLLLKAELPLSTVTPHLRIVGIWIWECSKKKRSLNVFVR